ncbi:hypothetical protein lbkm_3512 [Lachnospiraceae bacterium KM106-2]|nr:hypothetical protein lbkm_3512 [Lachnospiraceae bacterium KM106-2]
MFSLIKKVIAFLMKPLGWLFKRIKWFFEFTSKKVIKTGNKQRKLLKKAEKTFKITVKKK